MSKDLIKKTHLNTMAPINPKDAKYYLSLGLTLIIKKEGVEIMRSKESDNPQILNFLNLKDHEYFIPINRRHKFLKYLAGQVFMGYFLGHMFALLGGMFLLILIFNLSLKTGLALTPFLIVTSITSLLGFKMASRARKRITKSLSKYK